MPRCQVSTTINAPIDLVWSVLIDVEQIPEWTPTMRWVRALGDVRADRQFGRGSQVRIKQPWLPSATWTVDLYDPPRYFSRRSRTGSVETIGEHLLENAKEPRPPRSRSDIAGGDRGWWERCSGH